jgi:predicted Fe-S protein YdhL (DUF1289 family)
MRLTEHAIALGSAGARKRWEGVSDAERKRIMADVRAAKKRREADSNPRCDDARSRL